MPFEVCYSPEAVDHLSLLSKAEQMLTVEQVDIQLTDQPKTPTRKRKVLRPNPIAPWVLRVGDIRVFYEVEEELSKIVMVKAVGKKVHNELWIGGKKIEI